MTAKSQEKEASTNFVLLLVEKYGWAIQNVSREIWFGNSKKLICIDQSKFYIFSNPREFKYV